MVSKSSGSSTPGRPRIEDVARAAGVSTASVSYALNGRGGVSDKTRQHIVEVAKRLGWSPHEAARRLSSTRSETIGLVISRAAEVVATEPFFGSFTAGVSEALSGLGYSLCFQVVPDVASEMLTLEKWSARKTVDGVLLLDPRTNDPRIRLVEELGLPTVIAGGPVESTSVTSVWTDDYTGMRAAVAQLMRLGHRRFARIIESDTLLHSRVRTKAMVDALADAGLPDPVLLDLDNSRESIAALTKAVLDLPDRPTAVMCDDDLVGISVLAAVNERGLGVPDDVSVMVWDDSLLCQMMTPSLSAMRRDVLSYGSQSARALVDLVQGARPRALLHSVPTFVRRASIGTTSVGPAS
ncbi:LacI family DNA-binding transcriptional regulator [Humibacter albus]|uniref:LacI family DNA-binding transcriptional regulator n=1 Tax=Humibacter albus TaxID=427754 RepID=UPI0003B7B186|nr:LacI family DNA-binding transcriptional regulator [Humibacter albus]